MSDSPPSKIARTNSDLDKQIIKNMNDTEAININNDNDNVIISEQLELPDAPNWLEFVAHPLLYKPLKDFVAPQYFTPDEETALTHCIRTQNFAAFQALMKAGADPNTPSRKGVTPISAAAHKGNIHVMQLLIDAGAAVNSLNTSGSTALIQAAHFGHLDAVKLLLKNNATADFANGKGTTALMRASQEGHVDISRELIVASVDVNRKNNEGMNALMLASQRGHSDIVTLLIKAGAAMDEQTSQGSTALMLACKRGHEKCAEVLVSMGAEIYMKDKRERTARDTALRRNHTGLLVWLSTRVQTRRTQEIRHVQRNVLFKELRQAYLKGKLVLNPIEQTVYDLSEAIKKKNNNNIISEFLLGLDSKLPVVAMNPQQIIDKISESNELDFNTIISKLPIYNNYNNNYISFVKKNKGYQDWKWTSLLFKCMSMPNGVFEHIIELLPIPRVWQWSMLRIKRRVRINAFQAIKDMSDAMDGMLGDACIFSGEQSNLLVKINTSPQIHDYLLQQMEMPIALLHSLCKWADVQSLISRYQEEDIEVVFKSSMAREMFDVSIALYRWFKYRLSAVKYLGLVTPSDNAMINSNYSSTMAGLRLVNGSTAQEFDDVDMMEATDAGGEDDNSENEDIEGLVVVDLDTENELIDNQNFNLEDSDNDDGNQMNVVQFGNNM